MGKKIKFETKDSIRLFLWILLIPYLLSFILTIIFDVASNIMNIEYKDFLQLKSIVYITSFIMEVFFVAIFFIFVKKRNIDFIKSTNINKSISWQQIAICIVLAGCLYIFATPFCACFESFLGYIGYDIQALNITLNNPLAISLSVLFLAIVPAFIEELIFRGAILQGLKKYGKWFSILISALLFTLMHGNIQQTIYQFGCGVLFGLIVWETGSLWASIILHGFNNLLLIVLQTLVDCNVIVNQVQEVTWTYFCYALFMLVILFGLIFLAFKLINYFKLKKEVGENSQSEVLEIANNEQIDIIDDSLAYSDSKISLKDGSKMFYKEKSSFIELIACICCAIAFIIINTLM